MICHELAAWKEQSPHSNVGLSLKDVTIKLAAPRARLHAQLKELVAMGIVRTTDKTESKLHRGPSYVLTTKGQRQYAVFAKYAASARAEVTWLLFHRGRKRHEAWAQMSELLTKHLAEITRSGQ
jgi:DNA-binding MarR family transcriptional regulator